MKPHYDGNDLTPRQQSVLDSIREMIAARGIPPTMREIGEACGLASTNSVRNHLEALTRKGYLLPREYGLSRGIVLAPPASPITPAVNRFGVDVAYFRAELMRLVESLPDRPGDELAQYLHTLAATAATGAPPGTRLVMGVDYGPDGVTTVHGYRDEEGRIHITSIEEPTKDCAKEKT